MYRNLLNYLEIWLVSENRKPLIVRGARQVGKTWLIRHFSERTGRQLIEINFEKDPSIISLFNSNDPKQILLNLSARYNQPIEPEHCLLFLDEIQAAPAVLSKLRWFYEELPQLPVAAAGSLLEFLLENHTFSMPVGRISYCHLEPLSFEEFLLANDKPMLHDYLCSFNLSHELPIAIHEQFMQLFKEYLIVGGLPAAVKSWVNERSLTAINQIHMDLLTTYRDDFSKYKGRIATEKMDEVIFSVPKMLGQKFVYSRVNPLVSSQTIKQILDLLNKARVCHRVFNCYANGVPLKAEIKDKGFKEIYLDTGLCCATLGLGLHQINEIKDIMLINQGGISEQVVGQLLRTINPPYIEPELYYWTREEKSSNAEIDYIIQHGNTIVPIEVKSGSTGSLKSLHLFMELKGLSKAIRINSGVPSETKVEVKSQLGKPLSYYLLSIPFYMVGQIYRF